MTVAAGQVAVAASASPGAGPRRKRLGPGGMSPTIGWLFILPNLLGFLAFTLVPLVSGIAITFTDWNVVSGLEGITFIGVDNFVALISDDKVWRAVGRTFLYAGIGVPLTMAGGLVIALCLNGPVFGQAVLRAIFFVPHIVSSIAIGFVWLVLLHPTAGLVNQGLGNLGVADPPAWLVDQQWSLMSLILITSWAGMGFHSVIFLSALQAMQPDLYEAAELDGAGRVRKFWTITWPALLPTTTFLLIMSMIGHSQGFGLIAFLTSGGPGESSTTLSYLMYQTGFQFYRFGYAAAMGMLSFVGVALLTAFIWRIQRGRGLYT
ncbi:binding-protein-dependent transport systems inner membrane component [Beutenbergia cavernae DSM 12333]|uniref:Binding-protein-dependent transport systems inner membrane component n=1 Tax=Beutenbergia cavernae (strain ATCC BAA-8 / DSM 12333 / CCUG 43141 / JCM 11478 / NBRC 16432 / NCIMB 13614 / HKI 0122) TaxID=471853 RepID=C5BYH8_BEUC1|nr:sugar ABC transporter permease [Beutenbergia cavernae]ACQ81078.1 binding-protein-dependent transport systems inner membrane component [Beutenbergia cavernae DSM 12333]